mmetsp:Transcript_10327/g.14468  ORF Transcript_10327/g.14468 Transcript_10327/m.14468 type:complete len:104 (+) Transcript_10327:70-381(+)
MGLLGSIAAGCTGLDTTPCAQPIEGSNSNDATRHRGIQTTEEADGAGSRSRPRSTHAAAALRSWSPEARPSEAPQSAVQPQLGSQKGSRMAHEAQMLNTAERT